MTMYPLWEASAWQAEKERLKRQVASGADRIRQEKAGPREGEARFTPAKV